MGDKAANPHPSAIEHIPDQFRTQEMCDKAINICVCFVFGIQYTAQELRGIVVSLEPFFNSILS